MKLTSTKLTRRAGWAVFACLIATFTLGLSSQTTIHKTKHSTQHKKTYMGFISVATPVFGGNDSKVTVFLVNHGQKDLPVYLYSDNPFVAITAPMVIIPSGKSQSNYVQVITFSQKNGSHDVTIHGFYFEGTIRKEVKPAILRVLQSSLKTGHRSFHMPDGVDRNVIGNVSVSSPWPINTPGDNATILFNTGISPRTVALSHTNQSVCKDPTSVVATSTSFPFHLDIKGTGSCTLTATTDNGTNGLIAPVVSGVDGPQ
jgi:hypothetical protein